MLVDLLLTLGLWRLFHRPKPVPVLRIVIDPPEQVYPEPVTKRVAPRQVTAGRRRLLRNGHREVT